ncbi:TlpA family protein disulfide reductase [Pedobacter montanisoli]|uniref:TlpA family protein disulfide reductase n=1 Tax=Pedobacter montanisoli TaxID=2923277 RepID=A0ABS9ZUZ1_9SPHI|nr:TlpA disulfide reductase family protein [Pedobacter montanisoli]MCJ0741849.1 TlpA family protein disulfide reductase [Pedobacter montanisoli]
MFKKITLLGVLALLCLNFLAMAQASLSEIKPLKVGDKLPDSFWQQEHNIYANGQTTKQTLAQYKGKLLILDFWATWCGSCIAKFPLLNNLQQAFAGKANILLINKVKTDANQPKVIQVFDRHNMGLQLGTILSDTYLGVLFPHWQLPHYVWIGANGTLIGITNSDFINAANIEAQTLNAQKVEGRP